MPTSPVSERRRSLLSRMFGVTLRDENRLRRRLDQARTEDALERVEAEIGRAETVVTNRRAAVPRIEYPQNLPVSMRRDDIAAAIDAVIEDAGAATLKDMGKVMAGLKEKHAGSMDFSMASAMVKERLT